MSVRKSSRIRAIQGNEGTKIKQYFHPHNTAQGINYSVAHFTLGPGRKSRPHRISSSEIYYILEGSGSLKINNDVYHLEKDDSAYIPPNSKQCIENTSLDNLRFLCIVEPAWKEEDEVLLE